MKRVFDILSLLEKVCLDSKQKEMHKMLGITKNVITSWNKTNYFISKIVFQNQTAEIITKTKNEFGDDGLFNLIESFVQEFEDLYSEGGLIPMDSPNKNIENFLISKGLEIY
jgi:hypothetical protein